MENMTLNDDLMLLLHQKEEGKNVHVSILSTN